METAGSEKPSTPLKIKRLKPVIAIPQTRLNFVLTREEREIVK